MVRRKVRPSSVSLLYDKSPPGLGEDWGLRVYCPAGSNARHDSHFWTADSLFLRGPKMHSARDPVKTRKAVSDPNRPGMKCKAAPGAFRPVIDRQRCEGKGDCVAVCPFDVFEVGTIEETTYRALPALVRLKLWVHGKKTAHTPRAAACQACGLCVVACPEHAITLVDKDNPLGRNAT